MIPSLILTQLFNSFVKGTALAEVWLQDALSNICVSDHLKFDSRSAFWSNVLCQYLSHLKQVPNYDSKAIIKTPFIRLSASRNVIISFRVWSW